MSDPAPIVARALSLVALCALGAGAVVAADTPTAASNLNTQRFDDYRTAHAREHTLEREAIGIAANNIEQRLEGMNELRAQINTERGQFATRVLHDSAVALLTARIEAMEKAQIASESANKTWTFALGILFTLLGILMRFVPMRAPRQPAVAAVPVVATTQTTTSTSAAPVP